MGVPLHFLGSVWASLYCEWEGKSHRGSFINSEAQMRQAGTGAPAPITLATGSRALALSALGIIVILCVSGQGGHCCCFYPLTKARPARPAVSEFLWLGGGGWC